MGRVTTLTSKGQVTIPKEIRDQLGLKPRDKIGFSIENGTAKLCRARLSLSEMVGMLPPIGVSPEDMPELAWEEWVKEFAEKNR